jgi:serine phosphatase RsbU (regulator of sigma subunit)
MPCGRKNKPAGTGKGFLCAFLCLALALSLVSAVYADGSGRTCGRAVNASGGVNVIEGDRVTASYSAVDGIANSESLTVAEGFRGDILLGTDGGGLYVIGDGGVTHLGKEQGLSSEIVMRIKRDRFRDILWLVTSNSISYMTPDYRVTAVRSFPYSNNFDLYQNSRDEMWILSSNGIYVSPTEDMLADRELKPIHYGMANGLHCITTANSYSELTPEGYLYIPGKAGVTRVNIEEPMVHVGDLKAIIPYLDADGTRVYPDAGGDFRIGPRVRKVTIYSYVFNYSLVDPQVTYQLEGFDREAAALSRSDLVPADYTNLPGGAYRFTLQLSDSLGYGSKTLSVQIVKEKSFYEQTWFFILAGLLAAALLFFCVRLYLHRRIRSLEKRHQEEKEKERFATELHMANRIQTSMLPHDFPPFPDRREFDIYASMDPAKEVGGDFYDFFLINEDHLCLVIADVSGKGIPAALFMMTSKVILQSCAMLGQSAAEILRKTNEALCSGNQAEMFVTVWLGILEISSGKITAANAGHEYPALMKDGRFSLLKDKHGFVIGGMEGAKYREYEIQLEPGDKLFVYTDGVPEATDAEEAMFGTDRMLEALNEAPEATPRQILKNVRSATDRFVKDAEQFDDLTMLCIEYRGNQND